MTKPPILEVRLYGAVIGTLTQLPGDRSLFAFSEEYIENSARPVLGLAFKDVFGKLIIDFRPTHTRLLPFFSNLLPEGTMRDYLAKQANVRPTRELFLAWALGRDLPGALHIAPAGGETPPSDDDDDEPDQISTPHEGVLRFSLAGVQLKFSAANKAARGLTIPAGGIGGSWIVKLPSAMYPGIPENEFAMLELARQTGIAVPETKLVRMQDIRGLPPGIDSAGVNAFAIKRFDRAANGTGIHIEDFAQVFSVYPEKKYEKASYRSIAKVLWVETGEAGTMELVRRLVFNALIGNADMHLKNWSLIYPDRRHAQLAPAYDFVSTIAYLPDDKMALTFVDSKKFSSLTREQFVHFAAKSQLPEKLTLDTVDETVLAFAKAWREAGQLQINPKVRRAINAHLKTVPLWGEICGRK